MSLRNALCALAALLVAAGCSQEELLQKISTPEDRATAEECLERLRVGDIDTLENRMDPSLKTPDLRATLEKIATLLPGEKPQTAKLVGAQVNSSNEERTANLTYQYGYPGGRLLLVNCAMKHVGTTQTIIGISVNTLEKPLEQARFSFEGKSAKHYAIVIAAILFVLATLVALVICVMERGLRRKWLWILFILFGFGDLTLNWETGEATFSTLSVLLFSAAVTAEMYGPWMVSVAVPIGAVWYLVRRFLRNHPPADGSNPD